MTENEKICPIMSQPVAVPHQSGIVMHYELCQKERCMAWESNIPVDEYDTFEGGRCRLIP